MGWGDDYEPHGEGQQIDLTGLPAGDYVLVHTANPDRRLRETDYGNNSASLRLRLGWSGGRDGRPVIEVLARCPSGPSCPRR